MRNGKIPLDRNPKIFAYIIEFLNNGCVKPRFQRDSMNMSFEFELKFWGLNNAVAKKP